MAYLDAEFDNMRLLWGAIRDRIMPVAVILLAIAAGSVLGKLLVHLAVLW